MTIKRSYRTGGHWGVTIVKEGVLPADADGHRLDDALVAVVMNGVVVTPDLQLAMKICDSLNDDKVE